MKKNIYTNIGGMNPRLRTNQDIEFYFRLAPRYKIAYINKVLAEYSPGPERAYEVASNLEPKKYRKGKARVYIDRIDSLKLSLADRKNENDNDNVYVVEKSIIFQMKNLAGEYRKQKMHLFAMGVYIRILHFFLSTVFRKLM